MRKTRCFLTACGLGMAVAGAPAQTQPPTPAPHAGTVAPRAAAAAVVVDPRWSKDLDQFDADDKLHAPERGGVLFVGSSSIRLWDNLEADFKSQPIVLKRGFGGSRLVDCATYVDRLVLRYAPSKVIVYAGDNDLAEGRTPKQVLESFEALVTAVQQALPDTHVAYLSIKPSPVRRSMMPLVREANALIRAYTQTKPNLDFIDIYSLMVDADGQPRPELFRDDQLHMNAAGYEMWRDVITAYLR